MAGRYVGETAVGIAAAVKAGGVSPTEVLEEHLERIAALDGRLGAFRLVRAEEVLAEARALEGRDDLGRLPLAGVPVAIKDNIDLAGYPTRNGSAATSPEPAAADDELARACARPGRCWSARPACPSCACGRSPRARPSGSAATPGAWTTPPAAPRAAAPPRWPRPWSRSPWPPTAPAPSACRPPTAGWSASSPGPASSPSPPAACRP